MPEHTVDSLAAVISDLTANNRRAQIVAAQRASRVAFLSSQPTATTGTGLSMTRTEPAQQIWTATETGGTGAGAWSAWEDLDVSLAVPVGSAMWLMQWTYENTRTGGDPSDAICGIGYRLSSSETGLTIVESRPVWSLLEMTTTTLAGTALLFAPTTGTAQIRYRRPSDDYTYTVSAYGHAQ